MHGFDEFDSYDEDAEWGGRQPSQPRCKKCGSTDVRWRQQGGKWVLFSMQPGVIHNCDVTGDFDDESSSLA
jgi:hypothetical protein